MARGRWVWWFVGAVACTSSDDRPPKDPHRVGDSATPSSPTGDSGPIDSGPTDTAPTTPALDCADVPPPPFPMERIGIETEEDFDFDPTGYLIHQFGSDLVGIDQAGAFKIIAPNASQDPAGLQVLSTGDIALSDPSEGSLKLFDAVTGGARALLANVSRINGIEIDSKDRVFYSEMTTDGYVGWIDPYTGEHGIVLADLYFPNGLAFSPDEQTLYIAGGPTSEDAFVLAVDLVGTDVWGNQRVVLEAQNNDTFDAVEVDSCGSVYTVGYSFGNVLRTWPDIGYTESLAVLEGSGFASMRFGNGLGGWDRDELYITNRDEIFVIDVDVPGRPHPTNP